MKKWIMSAAFLLLLGGYASAQKQTSSDTASKKTVKNGTVQKSKGTDTKPIIKKDTSTHNAKIKLSLPPVDTTGMIPKGKND